MALAFVLMRTEKSTADEFIGYLKTIKEVTLVSLVYGDYDIVVRVEASSLSDLQKIILSKVRRIQNVRDTTTLITITNDA
ncbi:MAG: Lrp/AsnC family transcriptional regulator [Candidatus Hodarchaeales archaeon]|jgi:DNA-binding Lrp family transcriptional regulator